MSDVPDPCCPICLSKDYVRAGSVCECNVCVRKWQPPTPHEPNNTSAEMCAGKHTITLNECSNLFAMMANTADSHGAEWEMSPELREELVSMLREFADNATQQAAAERDRFRDRNFELAMKLDAVLSAINKACAIIETGDQRLMASDGPINNQPPDISLTEWREMYVTLDTARRGVKNGGEP